MRNEKVEDPRLEVYWPRVNGNSFNPIDEKSIEAALEKEYKQIN